MTAALRARRWRAPAVNSRPFSQGANSPQSMIRKSGSRFSERSCSAKMLERKSLQSEAICALVGPHDGLLSFDVAGGTAIDNLVERRGQHCRRNRFDLHRRATAPADYGHRNVMRFLMFTLKRHRSLRTFYY